MSKQKTQIFIIHGGTTFENRKEYLYFLKTRSVSIDKKVSWKDDYLDNKLGDDFDIIRPHMPNKENAKYKEWAIHFERLFPKLKNNIILIGESLGGIFLAKYLSENKFPKKIKSVYLVCPPFDGNINKETLAGGFKLKSDLSLLEKNSKDLTLLFSKNDDLIPLTQAKKYAAKLKDANIIIYKHIKGHFRISKFPEIIAMIKKDVNKK